MQSLAPPVFHLRRYMSLHTGGFGERSFGVFENVSPAEPAFFHQTAAVIEVRFLLPRKPHDYICGDAVAGIEAAECFHDVNILFPVIRTVHAFKNTVAAALCGKVYMVAQLFVFHEFFHIICIDYRRFQRAQPYTKVPFQSVQCCDHLFHTVNTIFSLICAPVLHTVKCRVYACQDYLPESTCDQSLCFFYYILKCPAAHSPPGIGDNTV